MGGKCREWDGKAWVAQGGAPKMIYILWKFILSGGGVLFRSPKGFLNGILMLLIFDANYVIINLEISSNPQEIILFGGASFFPAWRAFWMGLS